MVDAGEPCTFDEVLDRLQDTEALDWEIKAARGGIPNAIWETVSAFANTRGGWLILGVSEQTDPPSIIGVADPVGMVRQLHEQMRNRAKISEPICGALDIQILEAGEHRVVAVRVPAANRRQRPVYTRDNPYAGTYVRRDEGDFPATRSEVDRMMREASDVAGDEVILPNYTIADLDEASIRRYRQRFQTQQPGSPHNDLDDAGFLGRIGAFRRDYETGQSGMTVAGLLMFGVDDAIRAWRARHVFDYRYLPEPAWELGQIEWLDRLVWEGNLFGAYDELYRRLTDGLAVPFEVVDGVRRGESDQHLMVREALVNLLVHADYAERDASLAFRSTHGYFFRNPGSSRVIDLDTAIGDRSDPRNPTLVRMFRLIGIAEEAGSGVPRIRQALRRQGYEAPRFDVGNRAYEFSAELRLVHLLSESDRVWLASLGEELADDEQVALATALRRGEVDNRTLRELTGSHRADTTQVLVRLRDRGLFIKLGERRDASYRVSDSAVMKAFAADVAGIHASYPDPAELGEQSSMPGEKPAELGEQSSMPGEKSAESSGQLDEDRVRIDALQAIASEIRGRHWVARLAMEDVILRLCAVRPLSLAELSNLLERDANYVRMLMRSLVARQQVRLEQPQSPRHPQQRYMTAIAELGQERE